MPTPVPTPVPIPIIAGNWKMNTDMAGAVELAAGEYRFFCDVPGHERMEGVLTVG